MTLRCELHDWIKPAQTTLTKAGRSFLKTGSISQSMEIANMPRKRWQRSSPLSVKRTKRRYFWNRWILMRCSRNIYRPRFATCPALTLACFQKHADSGNLSTNQYYNNAHRPTAGANNPHVNDVPYNTKFSKDSPCAQYRIFKYYHAVFYAVPLLDLPSSTIAKVM